MIQLQALSPDQCAEVRRLAASCTLRKIGSAAGQASRSKDLAFIDVPEWLSDILQDAFVQAAEAFGYSAPPALHLSAQGCRPRVASYVVGSHFSWHVDIGQTAHNEVDWISCSVQLSNDDDYEGGDLEIVESLEAPAPDSPRALEIFASRIRAPRDLGRAVLFASQWPHQVTPVTRGRRDSLVAWANVARSGVKPVTTADVAADQQRWAARRIA